MDKIYNVSNLYPEPMEDPQKTKAIEEIRLNIKRAHKADNDFLHTTRVYKVVGMLSLAKELKIITTEEYEIFFQEIFN